MDSWLTAYQYGKVIYAERLQEAADAHRFAGSKEGRQLPVLLRNLLVIFSF
jgi:hypothetical protein